MANKKIGVLWDWNGTIVDDAWLFVDILNLLLKKNNKPLVTIKKYKDNFCFPIDQYYKKIGLYKDKELFLGGVFASVGNISSFCNCVDFITAIGNEKKYKSFRCRMWIGLFFGLLK